MRSPLLTLTTDFGEGSHYVAQLKGRLATLMADLTVVDISHNIAPHAIGAAAWLLRETVPYFPRGSCHIAVVDPGVGSSRAIVLIEWEGRWLIGPDNGIWFPLLQVQPAEQVVAVSPEVLENLQASPTFHGRDVMAPLAIQVLSGAPLTSLGHRVQDLVPWTCAVPYHADGRLHAEIVAIDAFGNVITNVRRSDLPHAMDRLRVTFPGERTTELELPWGQTYAEVPLGEWIALIGSSGYLELARHQEHAARQVGIEVGAAVEIAWDR